MFRYVCTMYDLLDNMYYAIDVYEINFIPSTNKLLFNIIGIDFIFL